MLLDSTKPLPEPMMTNHQLGLVAFIWGQFHKKSSRYLWSDFENHLFKISTASPRGQWVNYYSECHIIPKFSAKQPEIIHSSSGQYHFRNWQYLWYHKSRATYISVSLEFYWHNGDLSWAALTSGQLPAIGSASCRLVLTSYLTH